MEGAVEALDQLQFMRTLEKETKEDRIAIVNAESNQGVNENAGAVRCKRWAKMIDIAQIEVCRLSNIVYVCFKRECDVQDDTQTNNLRGRKNCGIFNSQIWFSQSKFRVYKDNLSFITVKFENGNLRMLQENQDLNSSKQSEREVGGREELQAWWIDRAGCHPRNIKIEC